MILLRTSLWHAVVACHPAILPRTCYAETVPLTRLDLVHPRSACSIFAAPQLRRGAVNERRWARRRSRCPRRPRRGSSVPCAHHICSSPTCSRPHRQRDPRVSVRSSHLGRGQTKSEMLDATMYRPSSAHRSTSLCTDLRQNTAPHKCPTQKFSRTAGCQLEAESEICGKADRRE